MISCPTHICAKVSFKDWKTAFFSFAQKHAEVFPFLVTIGTKYKVAVSTNWA